MAAGVARAEPSIDQQVGALVVDHVPAVAAQQSVLHGDFTGDAVEGFDRTAEVVAEDAAVGELLFLAVELVVGREVVQSEREAVVLVDDTQGLGRDLVAVAAQRPHLEPVRGKQVRTVVGEDRGIVDEFAVAGEFQPEERRRDERQAVLAEDERIP